ncbi:flagellar basal body P-ring formation chaperone FlgA [Mucisphaera calidilacus]|nr:flagellar basal body P-ring formation chaperone FlgA [Mucisphaera calidilacus]
MTTRLLAMMILLVAGTATADVIRLNREGGSSGPGVTLGQVAELAGAAAEALADTEVARFEDGQQEVRVTIDQVQQRLDQAGTNWSTLNLTGYLSVTVYRTPAEQEPPVGGTDSAYASTQFVAPDPAPTIASAVNTEVTLDISQPRTLYDLLTLEVTERVDVPAESLVIAVTPRDQRFLETPLIGQRYRVDLEPSHQVWTATFTRQTADISVRPRQVRMRLARRAEVVVAVNPLQRGDVIRPMDLERRTVEVELDTERYYVDPSQLGGLLAGRSLAAGQPITPEDVIAQELVRRNDLVTVICRIGAVKIETPAIARDSGVMGDVVYLRNPSSGELFQATIIGRRRVLIEMPGTLASGATP